MKTGKSRLVAIVGGSGAGKTWLTRELQRRLGRDCAALSLDDFYRDRSHLSPQRRESLNFDHPRAIDWSELAQVLRDCCQGRPTLLPRYDFTTHTRWEGLADWQPAPMILVEGLWLLRPVAVRTMFDLSIFLDCPAEKRLQQRLARDLAERQRRRAGVQQQFHNVVEPMHQRYVLPQKRWADLVVQAPCSEKVVQELCDHLTGLLWSRGHLRRHRAKDTMTETLFPAPLTPSWRAPVGAGALASEP